MDAGLALNGVVLALWRSFQRPVGWSAGGETSKSVQLLIKIMGKCQKKPQKTKNTKTKNKTKKPTTEAFSPWWESLPLYCRRLSLLDVYSTFVLSRRSTITFSFLDNEVLVSRSWALCFFCCPP